MLLKRRVKVVIELDFNPAKESKQPCSSKNTAEKRGYGRRTELRTQVRKVSRKLCLIRLFSGWQEFWITTGLIKH